MRRWIVFVGCLLAGSAVWAAAQGTAPQMKNVPRDMRTYYVAFLVAGPKFAPGSPEHVTLMPKHLAFIHRMISERRLLLAGPFTDQGTLFGMAVVAAPSLDAAKASMEEDPAVQAGFFDYQIHPALLPSLEALRIRY